MNNGSNARHLTIWICFYSGFQLIKRNYLEFTHTERRERCPHVNADLLSFTLQYTFRSVWSCLADACIQVRNTASRIQQHKQALPHRHYNFVFRQLCGCWGNVFKIGINHESWECVHAIEWMRRLHHCKKEQQQ